LGGSISAGFVARCYVVLEKEKGVKTGRFRGPQPHFINFT